MKRNPCPRPSDLLPTVCLLFGLALAGCSTASRELALPASASEEIFDVSAVTIPPKPLSPAQKIAPDDEVPGGQAVIRCVVRKDGTVNAVEVVSTTNERFSLAVAAAVGKSKFSPAVLNGERVNCTIILTRISTGKAEEKLPRFQFEPVPEDKVPPLESERNNP